MDDCVMYIVKWFYFSFRASSHRYAYYDRPRTRFAHHFDQIRILAIPRELYVYYMFTEYKNTTAGWDVSNKCTGDQFLYEYFTVHYTKIFNWITIS